MSKSFYKTDRCKTREELKVFMDKTKANLVEDQKFSTKLIGFITLKNCCKQKFESKFWFRSNKLVKKSLLLSFFVKTIVLTLMYLNIFSKFKKSSKFSLVDCSLLSFLRLFCKL